MVTEVKAYQAEDGQIFPTPEDAAKHDAINALKKLDIFNHGSVLAVVDKASILVVSLWPLVSDDNRSYLINRTERNGSLKNMETTSCPL